MLEIMADRKIYQVEKGSRLVDLISDKLPHQRYQIVAAQSKGKLIDLSEPLLTSLPLNWIKTGQKSGLLILSETVLFLMTIVLKKHFPWFRLKSASVNQGEFCYAVECDTLLQECDLHSIEGKIRQMILANEPIQRKTVSKKEALYLLRQQGDREKADRVQQLNKQTITFYRMCNVYDPADQLLTPATGYIKAFKIKSCSAPGCQNNSDKRQTINGICCVDRKSLRKHLYNQEALKKQQQAKLPFRLAAQQFRLLIIDKKHLQYAKELRNMLQNFNFQVNIDCSDRKLGLKIKQAKKDRVYYLGVIGQYEINNRTIRLRKADQNESISLRYTEILDYIKKVHNQMH